MIFCIYIFLTLSFALGCGYCSYTDYEFDGGAWSAAIGAFFFGGVLALLFGGMCYAMINEIFETPYSVEKISYPLVSLSSNTNIDGSFFLGSGSINSTEHYFYYRLREDGNVVRKHVPVNQASIHEMNKSSEIPPHVFWDILEFENPWWVGPNWSEQSPSEYVFVVPKGTVVRHFTLN